jgi:hypothetical protein
MKRSLPLLVLTTALAIPAAVALVGACAETPPAAAPAAQGSCPVPGAPSCAEYAAHAAAPPTGLQGAMSSDPNAIAQIASAAATAPAGSLQTPSTNAPEDSLEGGLAHAAALYAPGLEPEGPILTANVEMGHHVTMPIPLTTTKCYIIVGYSPPKAVTDLDLNLLRPPTFETVVAQDVSHSNMARITRKDGRAMCPRVQREPYKLDVFASAGSGQVAVQLYAKVRATE